MTTSGQAPIVLGLFVLAQLLDGWLTYWGVTRVGMGLEMNTWLLTTMQAWGPGPALVGAKTFACFCGLVLYVTAYFRALAVATGICIGVAVVPWMLLYVAFA